MKFMPKGVCTKQIDFEIKDDVIESVKFTGGCPGNTMGVASLITGMNVQEAISRIEGIRCGNKSTSCPDQLAEALKLALKNK